MMIPVGVTSSSAIARVINSPALVNIVPLLHGAIMNTMARDPTLIADIAWILWNKVDAGSGVNPSGK